MVEETVKPWNEPVYDTLDLYSKGYLTIEV